MADLGSISSSLKPGADIRRLRLQRGITQRALAKKVDVTSVYLAYLEGGEKGRSSRTPSLPTLEKLG